MVKYHGLARRYLKRLGFLMRPQLNSGTLDGLPFSCMARQSFPGYLQAALWARARQDGFVGSGTTLRRIALPIVHVLNLQSSSREHCCYLNLGAHLDFLPPEGGLPVEPSKLTESHCAFRSRIDPATGPAFGWPYLHDPSEVEESIAFAIGEWDRVAVPFFRAFGSYPESFQRLIRDADSRDVHPIDLKRLALIAVHTGDSSRAKHLAEAALERAPTTASLLIADLNALLRKLSDAAQLTP